MRNRWLSLIAACVVFVSAFGGGPWGGPTVAYAAPAANPQCYLFNDVTGRWELLPSWDETQCFIRDSCYGGLGNGTGGCFKWAIGRRGRPLPWSDNVTHGEPEAGQLPTNEGLPLEYGLFATHMPCPETRTLCRVVHWRATARIPLLSRPDPASRRAGYINANEIVVLLGRASFLSPQRGIVDDNPDLNAGDVVYQLSNSCGAISVWRRGEVVLASDVGINWEPSPRLRNPTNGYWIQFQRANGQRGWIRAPVLSQFEEVDPSPPAVDEESEMDGCE